MAFRKRKRKDELVAVKPPVEEINPGEEEIERQTIQQMGETPQQVPQTIQPIQQQAPIQKQPVVQPQPVQQQPQIQLVTENEIINQKLDYLIQIITNEISKD